MKVIAVRTPRTSFECQLIRDMHLMRARVFKDRLGWAVTCGQDGEHDEFDLLRPTYILVATLAGNLAGCARLLPAAGPTMLEKVFPQLLEQGALASHVNMIESSRFCVDTAALTGERGIIHEATFSLLAGIAQWSLQHGYNELVTATDLRLERLLKRCGWPMKRLGNPHAINETMSVAGTLPVRRDIFERLRPDGYQCGLVAESSKAA